MNDTVNKQQSTPLPSLLDEHCGKPLDTQSRESAESTHATARLWPSRHYEQQVAALKQAIGQTVYLVELKAGDIHLAVELCDKPATLLDVIDFPAPSTEKGLAPHMLILDDGRGINLARVARVSTGSAFNPPPEHTLYRDEALMQATLLRDRRLSHASIAATSRAVLRGITQGSRRALKSGE
ncbi:MAG: hypothetical protein ACWA5X_03965 [bacterium]